MIAWKIEGIFNADVNKVDAEIQSIGDKVKPSDLVDYARKHKKSELYKCFEWDDSIAAEKYRIGQAQKVISFIVEVPEKKDEPEIRRYSLTSEPRTYSETRSFMVNHDEYEKLLQQALMELNVFRQKYKTLSELEDVFAAIDAL